MATYRELLQAVDADLNEWIPQPVLDDAVRAVEADVDLQAYVTDRSSTMEDVAPFSGYDLYSSLVAILVTANAVWSMTAFADEVSNLVLDHNAKLALAEKVVLRLRQAGMEYSADKVQGWIDSILDKVTAPE